MGRGDFKSGVSWMAVAVLLGLLASCGGQQTVEGPGALGPFMANDAGTAPTTAQAEGRLDTKDATLDRGTYGDTYTFTGAEGEPVRISLSSDDVDTYLYLYDARGRVIAEDDDSGTGLNSHLLTTLPVDGVYLVVATSYARDTGDYVLEVERVANTGRYLLLTVPADVSHRFGAEARLNELGNPYHIYAVDLAAGADIEVRMRSSDADSLLMLYDEQGRQLATDDDSGDALNALMQFRAPASERYYIVATTYSPPRDWESTTYQLVVTE